MPVKRKYRSNAERQAAYRERHPEKRLPTEAELALLARSLHVVCVQAVEAGTSPLPAELIGHRANETLMNLIGYLDPHPDGIRGTGRTIAGKQGGTRRDRREAIGNRRSSTG